MNKQGNSNQDKLAQAPVTLDDRVENVVEIRVEVVFNAEVQLLDWWGG